MTSKQSLTVAAVLVAITIAMLIVATGDRDADGYQGTLWHAPGALTAVGHHHRWRYIAHRDPALAYDDGDDCDSSWSDDDDNCDLFAGYEDQYPPLCFDGPQSAATQAEDTTAPTMPPHYNNPNGTKLALVLLLQQFAQHNY
jgi:hypothetical protein